MVIILPSRISGLTGPAQSQKGPDVVNGCLFQFFCHTAVALNCIGVWWDTISIPSQPRMRAKTLRNMHLHFSSTKYTIVHDAYLINFPWAGDCTPCLALVLSQWFTRGWTAVELVSTRRVLILFKDPKNASIFILKDQKGRSFRTKHTSLSHGIAFSIV